MFTLSYELRANESRRDIKQKKSRSVSVCQIAPRNLCLLLGIVLLLPLTAAAQPNTRKVLILSGADPNHPGFSLITQAVASTIRNGSPTRVEFLYELQESFVNNPHDPNEDEKTASYLKQKYQGQKIDLILALVASRLRVILKHEPELFSNVPKVFYDFESERDATLHEVRPPVTGVWARVGMRETLELALGLQPETTRVVVIAGSSDLEQQILQQAQSEFRSFEGKVAFTYVTNVTLAELKAQLTALPKNSLVIFLLFSSDRLGNKYAGTEALMSVAPTSAAPIYGFTDRSLGSGIVGGSLINFPEIGKRIGDVGLRILAGENAEAIPAQTVPNVAMFDWRELRRWGISERNLPAGSIVQFKQPTLWESYKWTIIGLVGAVIVETLLIAWLLLMRARRLQAEAESKRLSGLTEKAHKRLEEIVSNVPGIVWETRSDPVTKERRTTFVSNYLQKMLGYTPAEWLKEAPGFGLRIMPEEDREKAHRESEAVVETGKEGVSEFRWQTKDGRIRWVENYLSPIVDENEEIVGLRGVALDVTDRKAADAALSESESRLRLAQQAARVGTWEWDISTGKSVWSDMIWQLLGLKPGECAPTVDRFAEFIHPQDRDRALRRVNEVINSGGEGYYDEFRIVRRDETVLWISAKGRVIRAADGSPERMIGVNMDINERKMAEETVRQTEEKDRAILNAIPDLMFLQTRDGVYLDYHAANPKDLLAPPEAFIGKNMREILPPDLADQFARCFERAEEMGEPQLLEYKLTINETDRWFEARIVRSGENVLSMVREITQRVFIEEAIKRNEAQLAGIISSAMDAIITVDEDQRIMLFNAAAEKTFGCSAAAAMGQSIERFIPERFRWADSEPVRGFDKSNGTPFSTGHLNDLSGRKASGDLFPLEASISQVGLNGQKFYTLILRDITERKKAVDELRQSEQRFSKAFRANPQPMSLTTMADGRYIDVNDSFLEMSNYAREEVIGRTSLELGVWETPQHRSDFIKRLQDEGSVVNVETKFRTKSGFLRFLLSSAERLEIAGEECLLVASSDITERKQAEEALVKAHEELLVAHEEVNRLKNQLEAENIYLQQELQLDQTFGEMVGQSDALKYVLFKISQVALTDSTVLITGETGTGKELVARAIHNASLRKDRPLIRVNCAALPASLIESELFGYEKGAFTGALSRKPGRFELANGTTIFLDEIGDLPLESQVKLLRAIQEGEIERLGGTKTIKIDVRIIAATNRNLKQEIEKGTFREDLWYRLNVFPITVPPLRQRKDDIPPLTEYFASKSAKKFGKKIESVSAAAMRELQEHSWPGNVRELENVIERAVIHCQGNVLHLSERFETPPAPVAPDTKSLEQIEREYIMRILESTGGRIEGPNGAAKILGLNPSTLRTRIGKLGIQKQSFSAAK